jgi:hypothetical protein
MVLWGKMAPWTNRFKVIEEWRAVTDHDTSVEGYGVDSGHYIPEEAPESVLSAINESFT